MIPNDRARSGQGPWKIVGPKKHHKGHFPKPQIGAFTNFIFAGFEFRSAFHFDYFRRLFPRLSDPPTLAPGRGIDFPPVFLGLGDPPTLAPG